MTGAIAANNSVYFARGHCRNGSSCRYSHKLPADDSIASGGRSLASKSSPNMQQCNTIEDLVQLAYSNLDHLSPSSKSAFWAALPKQLLHQRMNKVLENMKGYDYRDIATIAISYKLNLLVKEPILLGCTAFYTIFWSVESTLKRNNSYTTKLQHMLFPFFPSLTRDVYQI